MTWTHDFPFPKRTRYQLRYIPKFSCNSNICLLTLLFHLWLRQDLNLQLSDYDSETLPIELPNQWRVLPTLQKLTNTIKAKFFSFESTRNSASLILLCHVNLGDKRTWTDNFILAKHALYQLSYTPSSPLELLRTTRFELISSDWKSENLPLIYTRKYIKLQAIS